MMKLQVYKDKRGEWRWRLMIRGRIIAESGEGYKRKAAMMRTVRRMITRFQFGSFDII